MQQAYQELKKNPNKLRRQKMFMGIGRSEIRVFPARKNTVRVVLHIISFYVVHTLTPPFFYILYRFNQFMKACIILIQC